MLVSTPVILARISAVSTKPQAVAVEQWTPPLTVAERYRLLNSVVEAHSGSQSSRLAFDAKMP